MPHPGRMTTQKAKDFKGTMRSLLAELGLAQLGANGRAGLPRCQGVAKAPRVVIDGGGAAAQQPDQQQWREPQTGAFHGRASLSAEGA